MRSPRKGLTGNISQGLCCDILFFVSLTSSEALDVSLVLPAYNESATILDTIGAARRYFQSRGLTSQIIVSADGDDGTRELCESLQREMRDLVVFGSVQRGGKGRGIRRGVEAATGAIIGFADADNKVPIEEFDRFLPLLRSGADVVIGTRVGPDARIEKAQRIYRRLGARAFSILVQKVIDLQGIADTQCGFKFFRGPYAKAIFANQRIDGYMFDVEILALSVRMSARLHQVPIRWRDDADSRLDLIAGNIQNLKDIFRIRRYLKKMSPNDFAYHLAVLEMRDLYPDSALA